MYIHKQCLHKRFAALPGYKDTLDMRKHVNSINGLAFVPVADVLRTCEDLKNLLTLLYHQVIGPVITYFESTWLYGDYPLQLWNVHTCTLHGDPRTNNYAEGGNNAINQIWEWTTQRSTSSQRTCNSTTVRQRLNCYSLTLGWATQGDLQEMQRMIGKRLYKL